MELFLLYPIEQLQDLVKGFTNYSIDSIEVHVKGVAQTDGLTRLVVGVSGEAGVKLVMKKNQYIFIKLYSKPTGDCGFEIKSYCLK
ncbi:hypothetical protein KDN24_19930 [Bacillus sp. Bva_UNVM-123]|uniref:hypothetical protein n=1 Tax=Bacillus sp. Bva_UNVM-123 TaxID=2829798 RepID=UPI00391EFE4A